MYWDGLYYHESVNNVRQIFEDQIFSFHFTNGRNQEIYMPLENLVKITAKVKFEDDTLNRRIRFWTNVVNDPEQLKYYREHTIIKNTTDTLVSVIKNKGLLII